MDQLAGKLTTPEEKNAYIGKLNRAMIAPPIAQNGEFTPEVAHATMRLQREVKIPGTGGFNEATERALDVRVRDLDAGKPDVRPDPGSNPDYAAAGSAADANQMGLRSALHASMGRQESGWMPVGVRDMGVRADDRGDRQIRVWLEAGTDGSKIPATFGNDRMPVVVVPAQAQ